MRISSLKQLFQVSATEKKKNLPLDSLRDLGTVMGTLPLKKEANYGAPNSTRLKGVCVYANSYKLQDHRLAYLNFLLCDCTMFCLW